MDVRWTRREAKGIQLPRERLSEESEEKKKTMITRSCRKCSGEHPVFYFINIKQTHLVMICHNRLIFLPYERGLDVEIRYSRAAQRIEDLHEQA